MDILLVEEETHGVGFQEETESEIYNHTLYLRKISKSKLLKRKLSLLKKRTRSIPSLTR